MTQPNIANIESLMPTVCSTLLIRTSPNNYDVQRGNGNVFFFKMATCIKKEKKTHHHGSRPMSNICPFPIPLHILMSTYL
jgi:hypothetical protein